MTLTNNELQFMTVLWNASEPLTSTEILRLSVDKTWKDASLHTILKKLMGKDAVVEVGFKKEGKTISRTFAPTISCDAYYAELFVNHSKKDTSTIPLIFSALLKNPDVSKDTIQELEAIIKEKKSEL